MSKSALQEIHEIAQKLPAVVLADIDKRIGDWLVSGGNENDPYIKQQLRFAQRVLENARTV